MLTIWTEPNEEEYDILKRFAIHGTLQDLFGMKFPDKRAKLSGPVAAFSTSTPASASETPKTKPHGESMETNIAKITKFRAVQHIPLPPIPGSLPPPSPPKVIFPSDLPSPPPIQQTQQPIDLTSPTQQQEQEPPGQQQEQEPQQQELPQDKEIQQLQQLTEQPQPEGDKGQPVEETAVALPDTVIGEQQPTQQSEKLPEVVEEQPPSTVASIDPSQGITESQEESPESSSPQSVDDSPTLTPSQIISPVGLSQQFNTEPGIFITICLHLN